MWRLGNYTIHVPSHVERIPVTTDPELIAALERLERHFRGAPAARIIHELALKGAEATERERRERHAVVDARVERVDRPGRARFRALKTLISFLASHHRSLTSA